jgi:hypothetical protein
MNRGALVDFSMTASALSFLVRRCRLRPSEATAAQMALPRPEPPLLALALPPLESLRANPPDRLAISRSHPFLLPCQWIVRTTEVAVAPLGLPDVLVADSSVRPATVLPLVVGGLENSAARGRLRR